MELPLKPENEIILGSDWNSMRRVLRAQRLRPSESVEVSETEIGTYAQATRVKPVSINPWHPFRIYKAPASTNQADKVNDWRRFRVRSGRVGVVFPNNVVDSDRVVDPYSSEQPVVAAEFLMPGYAGQRFWFWLEIGDGTAAVKAQAVASIDPEATPATALPTEVNIGGDFVNIHPKYRPIGYFEVLDPNTQSVRVVQNLVADLIGPMLRLCWEGTTIPHPVPIS